MTGHAGAKDDRGSLTDDFQALAYSVTTHPKGPWQGFEVEAKGKLAALFGREAFPQAHYGRGSRVVAPRPLRLVYTIIRQRKAA
jgi:site-specific DNA recombinase